VDNVQGPPTKYVPDHNDKVGNPRWSEYWESLIEDAASNKFCNMRALMKYKFFNQFKGE
jgi:hypothetical protein